MNATQLRKAHACLIQATWRVRDAMAAAHGAGVTDELLRMIAGLLDELHSTRREAGRQASAAEQAGAPRDWRVQRILDGATRRKHA